MPTLALEQIGRKWGWKLEEAQNLERVRAALDRGGSVGVYQDAGRENWWEAFGEWPAVFDRLTQVPQDARWEALLIISDRMHPPPHVALEARTLVFRPPSLTLGIECPPAATLDDIESAVESVFAEHGLCRACLTAIAAPRESAEHPDLTDFAENLDVPLLPYLMDRLGVFRRLTSSTGRETNVSEAAALLAASSMELVVPCTQVGEVSVAVGRRSGA
jgi:cobalt-precorrin 5A hydrolase